MLVLKLKKKTSLLLSTSSIDLKGLINLKEKIRLKQKINLKNPAKGAGTVFDKKV